MLAISPVVCNAAPSASAVNYIGIESVIAWNSDITQVGNLVGCDGSGVTITDWTINVANAPGTGGSGQQYLFELGTVVSGSFVASGIQVTIAETAVTGNSGGTSVIFNAGDLLIVRCTPTNTPNATGKVDWCQYRTSTNQYLTTGMTGLTSVNAATRYLAPTHGGLSSTEPNEPRPIPHNATFGNLYFQLSADPGSGKTVTVTFMKHSPSSGYSGTGSATIVTLSITGDGSTQKTASYTGTRVSLTQGDLIFFKVVGTAGQTASMKGFIGYDAAPTTSGDCMFLLEAVPAVQSTDTFIWGSANSNTTEATVSAQVYACTAKNLVAGVSGASASYTDLANTKTATCTVRKNGSSSGSPTFVCTGAGGSNAQYKTDLSTQLAYSRGDTIDWEQLMSSGTGVDSSIHYGVTLSVEQTTVSVKQLSALGVG